MNQIELGHRIKQCRKMHKPTQEQLAEQTNVSSHYIYEIEKGLKTMSLSTLIDISSVLNVSIDYLLFGNNNSTSVCSSKEQPYDRLSLILQNLSPQQRDDLAEIMSVLLPYLK